MVMKTKSAQPTHEINTLHILKQQSQDYKWKRTIRIVDNEAFKTAGITNSKHKM